MSYKLNLREFEAFRAVMASGTTTGASEILHVSQPSVSRMIANLEILCRTRLFERSHGRLLPTREAESLLAELDVLDGNLMRVETFIEEMKEQRIGHLRVVATSPMGYGPVPRIISEFTKDHPQSQVSLRVVPRREVKAWLENHPFDIGLVTLPLNYPATETEHLVRVNGVCVLPQGHPAGDQDVIRASDLTGEPFILSTSFSPSRAAIERILTSEEVTCRHQLETFSAFSICTLVASGAGVSVVDPFTAYLFRDRGLVTRPFRPSIPYEFGLVYPLRGNRSSLVQAFTQYCRRIVSEVATPHLD